MAIVEHIATLKHYKNLRHAGYTDEQAEAAVNALNECFDGVATKEDLKSFVHSELKILEGNIKQFINKVFIGTLVTSVALPISVAVVVGLIIKFLFK